MHRIYFDENEGTPDGRYGLWLQKSIWDLSRIPGGPLPGMRVVLYWTGESEMEGILQYDEEWRAWTAVGLLDTYKDCH
jgi:hypothetical protein